MFLRFGAWWTYQRLWVSVFLTQTKLVFKLNLIGFTTQSLVKWFAFFDTACVIMFVYILLKQNPINFTKYYM